MKVSTKLFNEQQIRQFSSLNEDIQKLQDKISSGKNFNKSTILNRLPPLIKGYLKAGGMVSENFYIDKEFETIDYCVIMFTEKIVSRYQNKFLN